MLGRSADRTGLQPLHQLRMGVPTNHLGQAGGVQLFYDAGVPLGDIVQRSGPAEEAVGGVWMPLELPFGRE